MDQSIDAKGQAFAVETENLLQRRRRSSGERND